MFKQMDINSKMQNIMLAENYYMQPYSFYMISSAMKQLLEKFNFELLHAFNFSCTWNKETSSCR